MYKIFPLVLLWVFISSCSKDSETLNPDSDSSSVVAGDQFIIDYTVGDNMTRAGVDGQVNGNRRIASLTYLLYEEGFFKRRREIPDMDKAQFPMTRDNMTWAQREALKDTLRCGYTYHVVFVANAKVDETLIINYPTQEEYKEKLRYSDISLTLPKLPIQKDEEMFYLFTKEVSSATEQVDRYQPYNCPVLLQRVVARTDFTRPVLTVTEVEKQSEMRLKELYSKWMESNGLIAESVKTALTSFADDLDKIKTAENLTEVTNLQTKIKGFTYWDKLKPILETSVYPVLKSDLFKNPCLTSELFSSWTGYQGEVVYDNMPNTFNISKWESSASNTFRKKIKTNIIEESGLNKFSVITFGQNNMNDELGKIKKFVLSKETESHTIPAGNIQAGVLGNCSSSIQYIPFVGMEYIEQEAGRKTYEQSGLDLGEILGYTNQEIITKINETLFVPAPDGKYKESFNNFTLSFSIPDLSKDGSVNVSGEWKKAEKDIQPVP